MRLTAGRLSFFWWGSFLRGWLQFGRGFTVVADKNPEVRTVWTFLIGPVEVDWWNRPDWREFCFTREEAVEDARDSAGM
jgi:hypothetical protein